MTEKCGEKEVHPQLNILHLFSMANRGSSIHPLVVPTKEKTFWEKLFQFQKREHPKFFPIEHIRDFVIEKLPHHYYQLYIQHEQLK
jgi:hypothetical protein